jgi:hypothetical protein
MKSCRLRERHWTPYSQRSKQMTWESGFEYQRGQPDRMRPAHACRHDTPQGLGAGGPARSKANSVATSTWFCWRTRSTYSVDGPNCDGTPSMPEGRPFAIHRPSLLRRHLLATVPATRHRPTIHSPGTMLCPYIVICSPSVTCTPLTVILLWGADPSCGFESTSHETSRRASRIRPNECTVVC